MELDQNAQGSQKLLTTYEYNAAKNLVNLLSQGPAGLIENSSFNYYNDGRKSSVHQNSTIPLTGPIPNTEQNSSNDMLSLAETKFNYDENGNLIERIDSCGSTLFGWDARNRLISISGFKEDYSTCTSLEAEFYYDALNRRTEKNINGVTTVYIYERWDIVTILKDGEVIDFLRTLIVDEPLALEMNDTTVRYYTFDQLGSVSKLINSSGSATTSYAYDAFGNVIISGEELGNPFQYTGRENDGTGLIYYRTRYFSPTMKRFISEDPSGLAGGDINYYVYVRNDVINFRDPFGLDAPKNPGEAYGVLFSVINDYYNATIGFRDIYNDASKLFSDLAELVPCDKKQSAYVCRSNKGNWISGLGDKASVMTRPGENFVCATEIIIGRKDCHKKACQPGPSEMMSSHFGEMISSH